jgi:hypothetical protein
MLIKHFVLDRKGEKEEEGSETHDLPRERNSAIRSRIPGLKRVVGALWLLEPDSQEPEGSHDPFPGSKMYPRTRRRPRTRHQPAPNLSETRQSKSCA